MRFWIFMLIIDLLTPIIMLAFGAYFMKNAPKEINNCFGYRTSMSMKNKETWEFAHNYYGKICTVYSWITLVLSIIVMLMVIGKSEKVVGITGGIVCAVQCVFLIGSIFQTEHALRKNFNKNGVRKK